MTDLPASSAPLTAHGADPLSGRFATPGDPAISLRAVLLAALTVGTSTFTRLRLSADVQRCIAGLRQLGVSIETSGPQTQVTGLGVAGLLKPEAPLQAGPSATSLAMLLGLLAPYGFATALRAEPAVGKGIDPELLEGLTAIGARLERRGKSGLTLHGACLPLPLHLNLVTPAEATKTALLLAGLQLAGDSQLHQAMVTRDHTEKLLAAFGADITVTPDADDGGGVTIRLAGLPELTPQAISVPGDPSAAAFAIVAALIIKGSDVVVENVLINPLRTGLIDTLLEMGGNIQFLNQRETAGEHIADLRVRSSWLKGVRVDQRHLESMRDDMAMLAVAAAFAEGETVIHTGAAASNGDPWERLAAGLRANKVKLRQAPGSLTIAGDGKVAGGGKVDCQDDPVMAMSFAVLGLASRHKVTIENVGPMADSFPDFVAAMTALGGRFPPSKGR